MAPAARTYFFVHVMKTGGSTLGHHIRANFGPEERYPNGADRRGAYLMIPQLQAALTPERRARTRLFAGHFPFYVSGFVPNSCVMALLRDPVERTISMLTQYRAKKQPDQSLEEVFEDVAFNLRFIRNHQTKMFSLSPEDGAEVYFKILDTDERRLDVAKRNLERVGVLGVQERFGDFLSVLEHDHGWRIEPVPNEKVATEKPAVSEAFRLRIEVCNLLDRALYDHALTLI